MMENALPSTVQIPNPVIRYVKERLGQLLSESSEGLTAEEIRGRRFIIEILK